MSCHHYHNDPRTRTVDPREQQERLKNMGTDALLGDPDKGTSIRAMLLGRS